MIKIDNQDNVIVIHVMQRVFLSIGDQINENSFFSIAYFYDQNIKILLTSILFKLVTNQIYDKEQPSSDTVVLIYFR